MLVRVEQRWFAVNEPGFAWRVPAARCSAAEMTARRGVDRWVMRIEQ
jgi:hypothetical protein